MGQSRNDRIGGNVRSKAAYAPGSAGCMECKFLLYGFCQKVRGITAGKYSGKLDKVQAPLSICRPPLPAQVQAQDRLGVFDLAGLNGREALVPTHAHDL